LHSKTAQVETDPGNAAPAAWFRFLAPSISDLIFIILLIAMTAGSLAPRLLGDASIGWHIRNGEQMLHTHSVTRVDSFSVTQSGHTWYAWEWLYDLLIAGIHHWSGLNGVVFFTAVIVALTFALSLRLSLRRGANLPIAVLMLVLALGASMIHLFARPHVISWLFTVVWFQVLDDWTRKLWYLPAIMLLWVNLHGGFVVGFVLLGLYMMSDAILYFRSRDESYRVRLRTLASVSAVSLIASLVNPYGYNLHLHVYRYLSNRWLMNHIDEFTSPNFHGVAQQCFVALLLIAVVTLAVVHRKPSLSRLLVLLFATYSGLYASRSLPVSSLLITLIVAPLATQALIEAGDSASLSLRLKAILSRWSLSRMNAVELGFRGCLWSIAMVLLGLVVCSQQGSLGAARWMNAHFDASRLPVEAINVVEARGIRDPIFAPDLWGGYLIYRLYPRNRVFVDDRHDFYGEDFFREYLKTIRVAPDWNAFLTEKAVNWAILPTDSSLANMLEQTSQWNVAYRDETAVLMERKDKM
jgi:hypothetical protein